jgi:hypothetical protein
VAFPAVTVQDRRTRGRGISDQEKRPMKWGSLEPIGQKNRSAATWQPEGAF